MIEVIVTVVAAGVAVASRVSAAPESLAVVRLTFPRTVSADQAVAAARSLAGLLPPWWRRFAAPSVTLEARASAEGITHALAMPASRAEYVTGALRAAIPGLRVDDLPSTPQPDLSLARELHVAGPGELRTDTADSANAGILASVQPLGQGERAVLQYVITPAARSPFTGAVAQLVSAEERPEPPTEPQFAVAVGSAWPPPPPRAPGN